ncbi:MAG: carboxy terminal-processing peptidase [Gammaproteobacteria bacterium]|nr:carboxy terminal-processing peptidase [Gammaproteobacteria bacterium]
MRNKHFNLLIALCMFAAANVHAFSPAPAAGTALAQLPVLKPQPRQALVDEAIAGILTRYHYGNQPPANELSKQVFTHYLENLDPNRSYFLQSDIDGFAHYEKDLVGAIQAGNLKPAFAIYNVYQQRVQQRIQYALRLLNHEPDFNVNEDYVYDRSKLPWASSVAELDEIWRKRVKNDVIGLLLAGKSWKQAATILHKRYENFDYRAHQVAPEDVFNLFMNSYTLTLDPHSNYFSPSESQQFQIQMSLKFQGIGASLVSEGEYTKVVQIIPGGPAARDKELHPDDRITGVAQGDHGEMVDVVGWRLDDVVQLIRGPKGTIVRLQILPAGAAPGSPEKTIRLVRDTVKLEAQAAHKSIVTINRGGQTYKIGVVNIPIFYSDFEGRAEGEKNYTSTTRDVRKLLLELEAEHVSGVVIDLRNNGGGALDEATKLTGLFIPHGPVVQIRDTGGDVEVDDDDDSSVVYTGPLVVLVNRLTASASEIFTAAIQDYHRGLVVGSTTYGKGTVQRLIDLSRYLPGSESVGELKLTVDKFYRVNGSSTQIKGVTPDIVLPSPVSSKEFGEETEEDALPWDQIAPAKYTPLSLGIDKSIPELNKLHAQRTLKIPEWALYLDGLRQLQSERDTKSVSLLLSERKLQQRKLDDAKLTLANDWRKLRKLPAAKSLDEAYKLPASGTAADGANASNLLVPDMLLQESAQITIDMEKMGIGSMPSIPQAAAKRN